jgi:hypothetical protein
MRLWNAVVAAQMTFRLAPEILNPVDMVMALGKMLAVIDPEMLKFRNIKLIIGLVAISVDHAVRLHVLPDEANQGLGRNIPRHRRMHLAGPFEQAKGQRLTGCAPASFAFANTAKIALINLDLTPEKRLLLGQM